MLKEINLTDDYLKAITGKFDLDTIFNLELINKNLSSLGSIPKCTSLLYLDLSQNKITSINGMENLVNIMFLDLSFNQISNLSPLYALKELINIKLQGNKINSPPPTVFAELKKLEKITFQVVPFSDKPEVNTSNPICSIDNYREKILDSIPQLKWLDGIPRDMDPFIVEESDNDKDIKEKLDPSKFEFDFSLKVKLDGEDVLPQGDIDDAKKHIQEKYDEFQKVLDGIKKDIDNIVK